MGKLFSFHLHYFYPRPLRGGRPTISATSSVPQLFISIHALCEEGDDSLCSLREPVQDFYPRPLRGGRLLVSCHALGAVRHFYPRPLRGGRPGTVHCPDRRTEISIHALCEEGDMELVWHKPGK